MIVVSCFICGKLIRLDEEADFYHYVYVCYNCANKYEIDKREKRLRKEHELCDTKTIDTTK